MKADLSRLYVITVISNPVRYKSRYALYHKFKAMCEAACVRLITVEMAFGHRPFELTERDNIYHLQLRSIDELWHKENMINLGIQYLLQIDPDAREVAWIDADVYPMRQPKDWFEETWHQLQHHEIVQMFDYAIDLDPNYNPIGNRQMGFINAYFKSDYKLPTRAGYWDVDNYLRHCHPGFAWAANISALSSIGGLIDKAILGAGDRHMALALIGCVEQSFQNGLHPNYLKHLTEWQIRALRYLKKDIGVVPGTIGHWWHGKKINRGYHDRWRILTENKFNPDTDLKRDAQGLYQLETHSERQIRLRDQIRSYFKSRKEDSIDI